MRDVLGTIQADQDAIIRAGSRGALVVDGGPGTGKTVVALHRTAYLLYSDPRLGHRRGGVLFVGPHQPYLAYVADVLPSLGEEGVQTCTLRDLVAGGRRGGGRDRPGGGPAEVVRRHGARRSSRPSGSTRSRRPTGMTVETPWADVWLSRRRLGRGVRRAASPAPRTTRRATRSGTSCSTILVDKHDDEDVPADLLRRSLRQNRELRATFNRAWPLLEAADLVGDLWSVPAYLRLCAPWLEPGRGRGRCSARTPQAWTVSDLPLLDAARQRLGDPEASRRRRRHEAARRRRAGADGQRRRRPDRGRRLRDAGDVDAARRRTCGTPWSTRPRCPTADPDLLAGPFAHIVVDEAQELTDAEWQMLLLRCPSRSFTIVGDRAQARHGFTESWQERLRAGRARPDRRWPR